MKLRDSLGTKLHELSLTREQKKLIKKHLTFYNQLSSGERKPTTAMQIHFVGVCNGKHKPKTKHEIAYLAFLNSCELHGRRSEQVRPISNNLSNPSRKERLIHEVDPRAPKPWSRYISEPLGTREDFKRDSAGNWSRSRNPK